MLGLKKAEAVVKSKRKTKSKTLEKK